ncbi:MAG: hypothetical protein HZA79_00755 [Sphingobacteriales bacterium]|nr:hypothetical protein [Sphingobacteriales bacterium]
MRHYLLTLLLFLLVLPSCQPGRESRSSGRDRTEIQVEEDPYKLDFTALKEQKIYSFEERAAILKDGNRGILTAMSGGLISLATNAVKKMIKKDRSRYTAEYITGQKDLVFYDQLSTQHPFDPVGMKFNGFTLLRLIPQPQEQEDTALVAEFELDDHNLYEILNNNTFRLKLKNLELNIPKAKVEKKGPRTLNMDIEISFSTSYVNEQGMLFDNVTLGKFYLFLRNAPVDKDSPGYADYYRRLIGKQLEGRSFIVPRSFGSYIKPDGTVGRSFSQGEYSISVHVKEASRSSFVMKMLMNNSDKILETAGSKLKKMMSPAPQGSRN